MANSFSITEAAAYLDLTVPQFRRAVERGEVPQPFINSRPQRWSRIQLDRVLDGPREKPQSFEPIDPIAESINALRREVRR